VSQSQSEPWEPCVALADDALAAVVGNPSICRNRDRTCCGPSLKIAMGSSELGSQAAIHAMWPGIAVVAHSGPFMQSDSFLGRLDARVLAKDPRLLAA
jgi:hypothetical protein